MMASFDTDYFFDLSTFSHAQIFLDKKPPWAALMNMTAYLSHQQLGKIEVDIPPDVHLVDPHLISIGKDTIIEPGVYIKGPCIIGTQCTIRHGTYIRGPVIIGNHCVVRSELKQSILLNNAHAAHFAYLGDSILGNHVNLGAGTKCANLKLNNENICIPYQGEQINTGLRKLGAIIGDNSQIGCNAVTNPGTLFGKNVFCYPAINIGGFVPSNSIIKSLQKISIVSSENK